MLPAWCLLSCATHVGISDRREVVSLTFVCYAQGKGVSVGVPIYARNILRTTDGDQFFEHLAYRPRFFDINFTRPLQCIGLQVGVLDVG